MVVEPVAVHEEVRNEEAAVETIGALKERFWDRNLAAGRRRQLKEGTQGYGGYRNKLGAARGGMTHRAIPTPCKGHGRQVPGKVIVVQGTRKGGHSGIDVGETEKQQRHKKPRHKGAATSRKREDIRQDLQEGSRA